MMKKKGNINIFLTIDNVYSCYLSVTIASILHNSKTSHNLNFYILDGGVSLENKTKIKELSKIKKFNIEYIPININRLKDVPNSSQKHISNATNYRFLTASLKPELNKCIFIDADLVFIDDIVKLWDINIEKFYMAAVPDQAPLGPYNWTDALELPKNYKYVNTGVCVYNLKKWRSDNVEEKFFQNVIKYGRFLKFPDQDILNITLCSEVKYLAPRFNAMPVQTYLEPETQKKAFNNPIVIHWAGNRKPWKNPVYPYAAYFWKYARKTPFYEDILYKNILSQQKHIVNNITNVIEKVDISMIREVSKRPVLKFKYRLYKVLSKITFGKMRKKYAQKRDELKSRLHKIKWFLKGI